jgi:hypothetical protein
MSSVEEIRREAIQRVAMVWTLSRYFNPAAPVDELKACATALLEKSTEELRQELRSICNATGV